MKDYNVVVFFSTLFGSEMFNYSLKLCFFTFFLDGTTVIAFLSGRESDLWLCSWKSSKSSLLFAQDSWLLLPLSIQVSGSVFHVQKWRELPVCFLLFRWVLIVVFFARDLYKILVYFFNGKEGCAQQWYKTCGRVYAKLWIEIKKACFFFSLGCMELVIAVLNHFLLAVKTES